MSDYTREAFERDRFATAGPVQPPATPQEPEQTWGPFFDQCEKCVTRTHCAHHDSCLAECVPADLRASTPSPEGQTWQSPKRLTLEVVTARDPGGFAGYFVGSVKKGKARIFVNIDAMAWAAAEHGERGDFRRTFIDSLAHEFLHALEESFGLLFDEEAVEAAIEKARRLPLPSPPTPEGTQP